MCGRGSVTEHLLYMCEVMSMIPGIASHAKLNNLQPTVFSSTTLIQLPDDSNDNKGKEKHHHNRKSDVQSPLSMMMKQESWVFKTKG